MADWKKLAKAALLSDGRIDTKEVDILRDEFFADKKIDKDELEFLVDLRKSAESTVRVFQDLFIQVVKANVLDNGIISEEEAHWLRAMILADGKVDEHEVRLLQELKKEAKKINPAFEKLYKECVKSA